MRTRGEDTAKRQRHRPRADPAGRHLGLAAAARTRRKKVLLSKPVWALPRQPRTLTQAACLPPSPPEKPAPPTLSTTERGQDDTRAAVGHKPGRHWGGHPGNPASASRRERGGGRDPAAHLRTARPPLPCPWHPPGRSSGLPPPGGPPCFLGPLDRALQAKQGIVSGLPVPSDHRLLKAGRGWGRLQSSARTHSSGPSPRPPGKTQPRVLLAKGVPLGGR